MKFVDTLVFFFFFFYFIYYLKISKNKKKKKKKKTSVLTPVISNETIQSNLKCVQQSSPFSFAAWCNLWLTENWMACAWLENSTYWQKQKWSLTRCTTRELLDPCVLEILKIIIILPLIKHCIWQVKCVIYFFQKSFYYCPLSLNLHFADEETENQQLSILLSQVHTVEEHWGLNLEMSKSKACYLKCRLQTQLRSSIAVAVA